MFRIHQGLSRSDGQAPLLAVLERVSIPRRPSAYGNYPHEFSGGMRQRIMIAMMIALKPMVLIADEPTTALDVTVQAQIMDLLKELQAETDMGLILITHDLGVVADVAERISVMYAGRTMEHGSVDEIYTNTANPYTYGLLQSIPKIDNREGRLPAIKGLPPSLFRVPPGCAFNPRCPRAEDKCRVGDPPPLKIVGPDHGSRCWFAEEVRRPRPRVPERVIEAKDLVKHYPITQGILFKKKIGDVRAVDGVNIHLDKGETPRCGGRVRVRQVAGDRPTAHGSRGADLGIHRDRRRRHRRDEPQGTAGQAS